MASSRTDTVEHNGLVNSARGDGADEFVAKSTNNSHSPRDTFSLINVIEKYSPNYKIDSVSVHITKCWYDGKRGITYFTLQHKYQDKTVVNRLKTIPLQISGATPEQYGMGRSTGSSIQLPLKVLTYEENACMMKCYHKHDELEDHKMYKERRAFCRMMEGTDMQLQDGTPFKDLHCDLKMQKRAQEFIDFLKGRVVDQSLPGMALLNRVFNLNSTLTEERRRVMGAQTDFNYMTSLAKFMRDMKMDSNGGLFLHMDDATKDIASWITHQFVSGSNLEILDGHPHRQNELTTELILQSTMKQKWSVLVLTDSVTAFIENLTSELEKLKLDKMISVLAIEEDGSYSVLRVDGKCEGLKDRYRLYDCDEQQLHRAIAEANLVVMKPIQLSEPSILTYFENRSAAFDLGILINAHQYVHSVLFLSLAFIKRALLTTDTTINPQHRIRNPFDGERTYPKVHKSSVVQVLGSFYTDGRKSRAAMDQPYKTKPHYVDLATYNLNLDLDDTNDREVFIMYGYTDSKKYNKSKKNKTTKKAARKHTGTDTKSAGLGKK